MCARRTRTLSIRISEDEYETLKARSNGARSVSATTREALRLLVQNRADNGNNVEVALQSLDRRLDILQGKVSNLSRTVTERLLGETKD